MAVTVAELVGKHRGKSSVTGDGRPRRSYTRVLRLESDEQLDPYLAGSQLGVLLWDPHPTDLAARVKSIDIADMGHRSPWRYEATIGYDTEIPEEKSENPFEEPVEMRWSSASATIAILRDRDDDPIVNTVGDHFDPPLEGRSSTARLTIVRNEPTFDGSLALQYVDRVNASSFAGADPGTLLCTSITSERKVRGDWVYWPTTYEWEYDRRGWQPQVLNQGLHELDDDGNRVRVKDANGEDVSDPVPLDEDGAVIPPDTLPGAAHWLTFDIYPEVDFGLLGLPV